VILVSRIGFRSVHGELRATGRRTAADTVRTIASRPTSTRRLPSPLPREPFYRLVVAVALAVVRLFGWKIRTSGESNLPARGPAIIASNHVAHLDFVFLGIAARERSRLVRFMAMREVFDHRIGGPLVRWMHHIPVDRDGHAAAALAPALRALKKGEVVGLHPEGSMSRSFVPMAGKSGAARLAIDSGAPLIPAAVWGSQRILPHGRRPRFPRGVAVVVRFGAPIVAPPGADAGEVTRTLMARIGELVDEAMADYPQRPRDDADLWWVPAHLGGDAPTPAEAAVAHAARVARRRASAR
jgi:1-acyl-sn-glycerol-3-phosphate acyltransferase